jgi:hypothetical protein
MTLSYDDVRRWNVDVIENAADTIRSRKNQLVGLQDELDQSFGPLFWHGNSATAARDALAALKDRAEHMVAEAGAVQRALYNTSDAMITLRRMLEEIDSTARANQFSIGGDGSVRDEAPAHPDGDGRARIAAELAHSVSRVLSQRARDRPHSSDCAGQGGGGASIRPGSDKPGGRRRQ